MKIAGRKEFSVFLLLLPLVLRGLWSVYRPLWETDVLFPLSILAGTLLWGILAWLIVVLPLYFSRSIALEKGGCSFRIFGISRKYR